MVCTFVLAISDVTNHLHLFNTTSGYAEIYRNDNWEESIFSDWTMWSPKQKCPNGFTIIDEWDEFYDKSKK